MKLFFSEFRANYEKYYFPYQVWLLKEESDEVEKILDKGFLPIRNLPDVYYLSRSTRADLGKFELSSENKRILKKTSGIESDLISLSDFNYTAQVQKFCKDYSDNKLGKGLFSTETIKGIFNNGIFNHVFVFKDILSQKEIGYAVCFISLNFLHYAYAFYDLAYLKQNLGARMMLEAVSWAKKSHKNYAYLGTCYERGSLYKTEFKGIEFFTGFRWSENKDELKQLITFGENQSEESETYLLRNIEYLESFYQGDLNSILNNFGSQVNF